MKISAPPRFRPVIAFALCIAAALVAIAWPGMSPQSLLGWLAIAIGASALLVPPRLPVQRGLMVLVFAFLGLAAAGFLPHAWFSCGPWRGQLTALGMEAGPCAFAEPVPAAEAWLAYALLAFGALYLLGHRAGGILRQRLVIGFLIAIVIWTGVALYRHGPGQVFGFFPNRNHTATLLAMAGITGIGALAHGILHRRAIVIIIAVLGSALSFYGLAAVSESRAGLVLLAIGVPAWLLLTGLKRLRGQVGVALGVILFCVAVVFLTTDSRLKERLTTADESAQEQVPVSTVDGVSGGRIAIYRDTLRMISSEAWTGVGPGVFRQLFPQYRDQMRINAETDCLHPESDWLLVAAESGWPAAICLAVAVLWLLVIALRQIPTGSSRALRAACLIAAILLCVHGIFDVPGHRFGLAWLAVVLLVLSLPAPLVAAEDDDDGAHDHHREREPQRFIRAWQGGGAVFLLLGLWLTASSLIARPQLTQECVQADLEQMRIRHEALVSAEPADPAIMNERLAEVRAPVASALELTPLDPHLRYLEGALALLAGDHAAARRAFAIQRALLPQRASVPLRQAKAWSTRDPAEFEMLARLALHLAARDEERAPTTPAKVRNIYLQLVQGSGGDPALQRIVLGLAGDDPELLQLWGNHTPRELLDTLLPLAISASTDRARRELLFKIWACRAAPGALETLRESLQVNGTETRDE